MLKLPKGTKLIVTNYNHKSYSTKPLQDIDFALHIQATLILDELCYYFNKNRLNKLIDEALLSNDYESFILLSTKLKGYK
jgi:uncharacterized protein YpiB (UPF0302 family)